MYSNQILVIDDDHDLRVFYRQTLEAKGYKVFSVTDGIDAFLFLEKAKTLPQLIVLDLQMPLMNGHVFLEEIKKSHRYMAIPIIIVSSENDLVKYNENFPNLKKPIDTKKFIRLVEDCFLLINPN